LDELIDAECLPCDAEPQKPELTVVEGGTKAPDPALIAKRDQLISQYQEQAQQIGQLRQQLQDATVNATRIEGAVAVLNDLLNG
jgi:hypothetical protein